jgi:crotonobetainyl-CoA:carnitine CoA-transferase CaiB-like acyl-CoA transferase
MSEVSSPVGAGDTPSKSATGPLSHIKVLDLSRVLAGPWASQLLGDLGADVIKIERPSVGDETRHWGPPWLADGKGASTSDAAYFFCCNRNKRSLTVDITKPEGQAIVRQLAMQSDVVLENFKVGGLAAYGLDYASLKAINPKLVYCSVTGFGQDGPYAERAGYDFLIQGMGGMMSVTGRADGEEGAGPQKVGVALVDVLTGMYATVAIQAALAHRDLHGFRSGDGQHIDLALLDVQVACLANQAMNYLVSGKVPGRLGNGHPNIVPYQDFPTADGDMLLAVGNDGQFARFCEIAGRREWIADERFATNAARVTNRAVLIPLLRQTTVMKTTAEWTGLLESAAVACGPINNLAAVFADPQVQHRGLRASLPHAAGGVAPLVANPINLSATPVNYRYAPPVLGQDTASVLEALGYNTLQVERLRAAGVV